MKYVKKPVVIDAVQWDGTTDSYEDIHIMFPEIVDAALTSHPENRTIQYWSIDTLEGSHKVGVGDFVIKGVKGEFYPCKPDIFELTYGLVGESDTKLENRPATLWINTIDVDVETPIVISNEAKHEGDMYAYMCNTPLYTS